MNLYLKEIYNKVEQKYYYQQEFLDTTYEFLSSISKYVDNNPEVINLNMIEDFLIPNKIITFKVPWVNDSGELKVNTGYRIQFNNLIGPYKGGIRYTENLNESVLKFLALEQTLKNSLTGLPLGGAKGGSDFNPYDKSKEEIKRFTESFMIELYQYLGPNIDVPAGDLGVSIKEIGYMYNMYKRLTNEHSGVLTGKHPSYGGSLARPESTGYGVCYITNSALDKYFSTSLKGKKVIISGSGQVGIHAAFKAKELGATIVGMSSISGVIFDENGIDIELVLNIQNRKDSFKHYLHTHPNATYLKDVKELWNIKADVILPCATQNEIDINDAKKIIELGTKIIVEGANKPISKDATSYLLKSNIIIVPSKVANSGGVATSGLEMRQNATFEKWTFDKVDSELKEIMTNLFDRLFEYSKIHEINLIDSANILAFDTLFQAFRNLN